MFNKKGLYKVFTYAFLILNVYTLYFDFKGKE